MTVSKCAWSYFVLWKYIHNCVRFWLLRLKLCCHLLLPCGRCSNDSFGKHIENGILKGGSLCPGCHYENMTVNFCMTEHPSGKKCSSHLSCHTGWSVTIAHRLPQRVEGSGRQEGGLDESIRIVNGNGNLQRNPGQRWFTGNYKMCRDINSLLSFEQFIFERRSCYVMRKVQKNLATANNFFSIAELR